jgi:hypothetical protein
MFILGVHRNRTRTIMHNMFPSLHSSHNVDILELFLDDFVLVLFSRIDCLMECFRNSNIGYVPSLRAQQFSSPLCLGHS